MSLILEYCSEGNLRDYLHKNCDEFNNQILNGQNSDNANVVQDTNQHNLSLLLRWSYQVFQSVLNGDQSRNFRNVVKTKQSYHIQALFSFANLRLRAEWSLFLKSISIMVT